MPLRSAGVPSDAKHSPALRYSEEWLSGGPLQRRRACLPQPNTAVTSVQRFVIPTPSLRVISPSTLWRTGIALLGVTAFLVARACGYEFDTMASYTGYFALYVMLPGVLAMYFVNRGPLSLAQVTRLLRALRQGVRRFATGWPVVPK